MRNILLSLVVFLSVSTHVANSIDHVHQADNLRDFWWQVSWRAPSIEAGTNLVASYAKMQAPEDYITWGPANLIYFPEKQDVVPIRIKLPAVLPDEETVANVLGNGSGRNLDRRGNYVHQDLSALLVITQPSVESCVRIIDGSQPELSPDDPHEIMLLSPFSLIGNVNMSDQMLVLPDTIFGEEPTHDWCWYYQKASLARQVGDWQTVITLGNDAARNGFSPYERIEWIPFIQAGVVTGDVAAVLSFSPVMNEIPFVRQQACSILRNTALEYHPEDLGMKELIDKSFCLNGETE